MGATGSGSSSSKSPAANANQKRGGTGRRADGKDAPKAVAPGEETTAGTTDTSDEQIKSSTDLKEFLTHVQFKMLEESAPPVYCLSALNHVMNLENIYDILDKECQELARDIWLHIKAKGFQVKKPPMLFGGS